jgi:hypothetical protein
MPACYAPNARAGCKAAAQVCYGNLAAEEPFLRLNRVVVPLIPPPSIEIATCSRRISHGFCLLVSGALAT